MKMLINHGTIWYQVRRDRNMAQKQKLLERKTFQLAIRLSKADYAKIQQLVECGLYKSYADFLRAAVHDKLSSMELVSLTEVGPAEAERIIEDYLVKHPGPAFASEIADALGLEYKITFKTIQKLLEEGRVKKAKNDNPH